MARSYRKVDSTVQRLRYALGVVSACDPANPPTYFAAIGAVKVVLEAALTDLQADAEVPASEEFARGYSHVADLFEPIPGMEV